MSHFAAFSLIPSIHHPNQVPVPVQRGKVAFQKLVQAEKLRELRGNAGEWILYAGSEKDNPPAEWKSLTCLPIGKGFHGHTQGMKIAPDELAIRLTNTGVSSLSCLAPPAGGLWVHEKGISVFTDLYGLQHVFFCPIQDGVVVGSSALIVAFAAGDEIDLNSFGVFGLLGHYLVEMCGFQKTRRLRAGMVIHLHSGNFQMESYALSPKPAGQTLEDLAKLAEEGAEILRKATTACLSAFPEPDLELSGGLDSRLLLATIPPPKRREIRAITLGEAGSHDRITAKLIAEHEGMAQHEVDLAQLEAFHPEEILPLIKNASLKVGHCANPFGRGVLEWVNSQVDQRPRLSGQNGEYIRGFYYPGQPDASQVTPQLVASLARWRMWTNQGVDLSLLTPEFRDQIQTSCLEDLNRILQSYGTGWLLGTDEFYLMERMGRWVGMDYSAATLERVVLAPFFHPAFVEWARTIPAIYRGGSSLSATMLEVLDPYLSTLPLDGGIPPRDVAHPNLRVRLVGRFHFATKVVNKAWQRITGRGKPPYGAETLYQILIQQHPKVLDLLPHISQSGFLDSDAFKEISTGQRQLDWKSLGFLLNLEWTYEFLESGGMES